MSLANAVVDSEGSALNRLVAAIQENSRIRVFEKTLVRKRLELRSESADRKDIYDTGRSVLSDHRA